MERKRGIIVALVGEARSLLPTKAATQTPIPLDAETWLYVSGMGVQNASQASQALISLGCQHLISWGCCAGLTETVNPGDIIHPQVITDGQDEITLQSLSFDGHQFNGITVYTDPMVHSDAFLNTKEDKRNLHGISGAIAADMESYIIARSAKQANIACSVVRSVSDGCDSRLPPELRHHVNDFGEPRLLGIMGMLLRKPSTLSSLLALGRGFNQAIASLQQCHKHMIE